jgi:hypothetical protein
VNIWEVVDIVISDDDIGAQVIDIDTLEDNMETTEDEIESVI